MYLASQKSITNYPAESVKKVFIKSYIKINITIKFTKPARNREERDLTFATYTFLYQRRTVVFFAGVVLL